MKMPNYYLDHQEVLRIISQSMVRLKRPERLLKLVIRFIEKELSVSHAGIMVFKEDRKHYIFFDSQGTGRIPAGLVRFDLDHPLVSWFGAFQRRTASRHDYIAYSFLKELPPVSPRMSEAAKKVLQCMETLKLELVIPAYFKRQLIGLLLLGKPAGRDSFSQEEISFFQIMTQDCSMAVKAAEYHKGLADYNRQLEQRIHEIQQLRDKEHRTYNEIMRSLASEVYAKDAYTYGHIGQVERLGLMTAKELGLDVSGHAGAVLSAGLTLHDVGKIGIPDHILNKPARLSPEEWEIMKTHVEKGAKILEPLTDFKEVREIVLSHHENYDGKGYPRGLSGEDIPIGARIVAVVDAYHAIVSNRCYSKGRPAETAFQELRRCSGTQFDPRVVEAFIKAMSRDMTRREIPVPA